MATSTRDTGLIEPVTADLHDAAIDVLREIADPTRSATEAARFTPGTPPMRLSRVGAVLDTPPRAVALAIDAWALSHASEGARLLGRTEALAAIAWLQERAPPGASAGVARRCP